MNREHENPFPTSVDPQEIFGAHLKKEPPRKSKRNFWFLCVPLGAVVGFFACLVGDSGAYFLPVTGVVAVLVWAFSEKEESK